MSLSGVFMRHELKYQITQQQKEAVLDAMRPYMAIDQYGRSTIRNLYWDTDTYLLVRRSIESPTYKEKLRIRSYAQTTASSTVFVELKKKYQQTVFKRRIALPEEEAMQWIAGNRSLENPSQIAKEIDYFRHCYQPLLPAVFLSYEREAYYTKEKSDFRVTFDDTILCRETDLSLGSPPYGTPLLPEGTVLMEIKCTGGIPLWMVKVLSENHIYKTPFSKYGTAYRTMIFPRVYQTNIHIQEVTDYAGNAIQRII